MEERDLQMHGEKELIWICMVITDEQCRNRDDWRNSLKTDQQLTDATNRYV